MEEYTKEQFQEQFHMNPAIYFRLHSHLTPKCKEEAQAVRRGMGVLKAYYGKATWAHKEAWYIIEACNWINASGHLLTKVIKVKVFSTEEERTEYIAKTYF